MPKYAIRIDRFPPAMKALLTALVTLYVLLIQPAGAAEQRVALVIGNAAYKGSPLANPVNDARAISEKLRSMGFDVIQRENLKAREIGSVYREFRSKIVPGGTALVFYAGHGLQFKGQNYFPAVDSDINSEDDVPLQSLNLGQLLDNMEEAKAGVSLVFLDACRDNPFARRFRSASRGLAKVEAASGTLIHYATRPGSVAADGDGQNGTYTEALLAQMSEPGVPVELMLKKVSNNVVRKTSGKQEPWVEGSLRGDFYFIFNGPTTVNVQGSADAESEAWRVAESIGSAASFKSYLEAYPKGRYGVAAKMKLDALGKTTTLSKSPSPASIQEDPETQFWNEVKTSGSREYYEAYARQYPKGKYLGLARVELKKLEDQAKADKARSEAEQKQATERNRQDQQRNEKDSWETAKLADSVASYGAYLDSYPKGQFATLAQVARQKAERQQAERDKQDAETKRKAQEQDRFAAEKSKPEAEKQTKEMYPGKVFRDCQDCPEMVVIPAGSFEMGEADKTQHISLRPYAIGRTEVTQAQWQTIMGNNPSWFKQCGPDCPVETVSWGMAQEFARRLTAKTGKQYRLPTGAEWEYACRAGARNEYCGSNDFNSVGWNGTQNPLPVARKQPNAFGLFDMSGNVWEWTQDCRTYNNAPQETNCMLRMLRGGSWKAEPAYLAASLLFFEDAAERKFHYGLRLVRDAK